MKKSVLLIFIILFGLVGCQETPIQRTTYTLDVSNLPETQNVSEFYISDIIIVVSKPDLSIEYVPVNLSMLYTSDIAKLSVPGTHTITIMYYTLNETISFTLTISLSSSLFHA